LFHLTDKIPDTEARIKAEDVTSRGTRHSIHHRVLEIKIPFYSTLCIRPTDFFDEGQLEGGKIGEPTEIRRKWMLMIVTASACLRHRAACLQTLLRKVILFNITSQNPSISLFYVAAALS
jgi:hypothetical protein